MSELSMSKDQYNERTYQRIYQRQRYRRLREKMFHLLGDSCDRCGSKKDIQIDHRDPKRKKFDFSKNWGRPWKVLVEELKKCQLLCRSCHKKKTSKEISRPGHGHWGAYRNRRCRCRKCKDFVVAYFRQHRADLKRGASVKGNTPDFQSGK